MALNREKLRELNRRSVEESFEEKGRAENAVDIAVKNVEKEEQEKKPTPDTTQSKTDEDVHEQKQSIEIRSSSPRKNTKLVYLTDKADQNMRRVAKENNISANNLVNQLLEQLR